LAFGKVRAMKEDLRQANMTIVLDVDPAEAALRRQDRSCFVELVSVNGAGRRHSLSDAS
jgi:hypothetical protein